MYIYLFKTILCSSIFILLYYCVLQQEAVFRFNRWFLLVSLLAAYWAPLLKIKPKISGLKPEILVESLPAIQLHGIEKNGFNGYNFILWAYFLITAILFLKAIMSVIRILSLKGRTIYLQNQKIKVLRGSSAPFSFLNTIYIGSNYLIFNKIDDRILLHECSHVQQRHSLDLILVEVFTIIFWFNPALYFYKRAITTIYYDDQNNQSFSKVQNLLCGSGHRRLLFYVCR